MINSLVFKKLNNLEFQELTNNNIFLFETIGQLREFYEEFEKLMKDINSNDILYESDNKIIKIDESTKCRGFTAIYWIDNIQRFIFTLEPLSILSMSSYYDLWFIETKENEFWNSFAFTSYKNYDKYKTNEDIYNFVCKTKYSCGICK